MFHRLLLTLAVTGSLGITLSTSSAFAAPGAFDPTLDKDGRVITDFEGGQDMPNGIAVQNDGKIVVAGHSSKAGISSFAVARYHPTGGLDQSFGTGGKVTTSGLGYQTAGMPLIQADGKIVVIGRISPGGLSLVRLHSNGTLDTSFGSNGHVTLALGAYASALSDAVLQKDGKILIAGSSSSSASESAFTLARLNTDGTLDTGFAMSGRLINSFGTNTSIANRVRVLADGSILAAGTSSSYRLRPFSEFAVLHCTPEGHFDADGQITTYLSDEVHLVRDLAVQEDGSFIVTGMRSPSGVLLTQLVQVRYDAHGIVDSSFGSRGRVFEARFLAHNFTSLKNGKIIVTGTKQVSLDNYAYAVACFDADCSPDRSFGANGMLSHNLNGKSENGYFPLALDNGKLLVAGACNLGADSGDFYLLRHQGTGPEIAVEQPPGQPLGDGSMISFDRVLAGRQTEVTVKIRNIGYDNLTGLKISFAGANAGMFTVVANPVAPIAPDGSSSFTVRFAPTSAGPKFAVLRIATNDADENPFDISLEGEATAPIVPLVQALPAEAGPTSATLKGTVQAMGYLRQVSFEYGLTKNFESVAAASPDSAAVSGVTPVSLALTDLLPHTQYHFRVKATSAEGDAKSSSLTFTTLNRQPQAVADDLAIAAGTKSNLPLLNNDAEADADALRITAITALEPKSAGTLTRTGGVVVFAAAKTFTGDQTAAFSYTVSDGFGGSGTAQVLLRAAACAVAPADHALASAGGTYNIDIACTGAWSVTDKPSWVSVTPASGVGGAEVVVTVQPHPGREPRSGGVKIGGSLHTVTQAGVVTPGLFLSDPVPAAMVGAPFSLDIVTAGAPVTYIATTLPAGLKLDKLGRISGIPAKGGNYTVSVVARNAAGTSAPLDIPISVQPLPAGFVRPIHGLISRHPMINMNLGSRLELTPVATGTFTGKIITGAASRALTGKVQTNPLQPDSPRLILSLPALGSLPILTLDVTFDALHNTLTGTFGDSDAHTAEVVAWSNGWSAAERASGYAIPHTFSLEAVSSDPTLPKGYGYGSFHVKDTTGGLTIGGKLADGNTYSTTTFLGPQGQVLVYQPLYGGKGSLTGIVAVTRGASPGSNEIAKTSNAVTWLKGGPAAARDTVYAQGFGPISLTVEGGAYVPPAKGGLIMGLPDQAGNAQLTFTQGGLGEAEFDVEFRILNPSATGLTNSANFTANVTNRTSLPTLAPASGLFGGSFVLAGLTPSSDRKVSFEGQIVKHGAGLQGRGFFLLSEFPDAAGETIATTPRHSGRVILQAPPPAP